MIFYDVLLLFFLLLCHNVLALDSVLSMTLWTGQTKAKWTDKPTWHQETSAALLPGGGAALNYEGVLDIAHSYYNWLIKQPNSVTPKGVCMVAAMWDPNTKIIYASSIPQGPRKAVMAKESEQNGAAPLWYNQVKNFVKSYPAPPSANPLHAEDGVFFNFETSKGTTTVNGKYPDGSIIAVWGKYSSGATDREISLCSTSASRNPTCQGVAQALGVKFTKTTQQTPQQAQEDSSDDEFGPPLTADDFDEIMAACPNTGLSRRLAIRGKGPIRRDASISCIPFPFPSDISASALSITLDPTDFDITSIPPAPTTTLGLIYGGLSGAPEFQTTVQDGVTVTYSYTYFIEGSPGSEALAFEAITMTNPAGVSGSRTAIIYETTVSGRDTTIVAFDTTTPLASSTAAAQPSCSLQKADPDQGINTAYCVCDQSITLPVRSVSITAPAESCQYASLPGPSARITPTASLGPATTNSILCQVCSPVVNNEDSCTTINGCIPQTARVTVQAGSSPVHVGTVTGTQLYTSVSNALQTLCPSVTQTTSMTYCSLDSVIIKNVPYVEGGLLAEGELVVSVESSAYNATSLRDAMIKSAALTVQNAATGKNCYTQEYEVEQLKKRSELGFVKWLSSFHRRDHPYLQTETATWCNTIGFAGVGYYGPYWHIDDVTSPTAWIYPHWEFATGSGQAFACDLLMDIVDMFAIVQPEFAIGEIELGEAINLICKDKEGY